MLVSMLHTCTKQTNPFYPLPPSRQNTRKTRKEIQSGSGYFFVFFATSVFFHSKEILKQLFFSIVGIYKELNIYCIDGNIRLRFMFISFAHRGLARFNKTGLAPVPLSSLSARGFKTVRIKSSF